jgi:hypothetical protein
MGEMVSILVHRIGKSTYLKNKTPGASQVIGDKSGYFVTR